MSDNTTPTSSPPSSADSVQTDEPPHAPRRLTKSAHDRKLAGVASGIADYFGIDPTIVRLVFVAGIFLGGFGLLAYLIAWIVLPADDGSNNSSAPHTLASTSSTVVAVGLLIAGAIVAAATIDNPFGGGWLVPLFLVGAGVFLLLQQADNASPVDSRPPGGAAIPASPSVVSPAVDSRPERRPSTALVPAPPVVPTPVEPEPVGPPITTFVFSTMALVIAGAFIVEAANVVDVSATAVVAICLGIVGLGLLGAAVWGGGRGLIAVGVLLTAALLVTSVTAPAFEDGVGEREYTPMSLDDVPAGYRHGVGSMTIDLAAIDFSNGDHHLDVHMGIGDLELVVPDDVNVDVVAGLDIGELDIFGDTEDGIGNDLKVSREVDSDATLSIDVDSGIGRVLVEVER